MNRSQGDPVRALAEGIRTNLRDLEAELERGASRVDVLKASLESALGQVDRLRGRIRYLGWTTDDAILDYLADGSWREREEIVAALVERGAPHRGTANRLRMLTAAGKLEKEDLDRVGRGNAFGRWRQRPR